MTINKGIIPDVVLCAESTNAKIDSFAVGVAVFKNHSLLLVRRTKHDLLGGMWEIPGGGVLSGESFADAARRELQEETGMVIKEITGMFQGFDYENSSHQKIRQINYVVTVEAGGITLNPQEHDVFAWIEKETLSQYPMSSEMASCIHALLDE